MWREFFSPALTDNSSSFGTVLGCIDHRLPASKSDASQEPVFVSGDDGESLGSAVGTVWKRISTDCSILPKTQRHKLRAAAAQPEVFHLCGVVGIRVGGRVGVGVGVGFQSKKSSFLKIAERCQTGRVGTLGQHREPITLYCIAKAKLVQ